jgi:hypothetical protein
MEPMYDDKATESRITCGYRCPSFRALGSGNGRPRGLQEIATNSKRLFEAWGGLEKLKTCLAD